MNYATFERRAHQIFDSIPDRFREGVDGLVVERRAEPHPSLPEVYTLGECRSEYYPSEFGGAGDVLSRVHLYYGSFLELARREEGWDWEDELYETITHEVRHHLESLASDDALEVQDYAEDQNFARREGEPFEPLFFRSGTRLADDVYEVAGDVFVEVPLTDAAFATMPEVSVEWRGRTYSVARPGAMADVHFVPVGALGPRESPGPYGGELIAVLVRRRGAAGWLRSILGGGRVTTAHEPSPGNDADETERTAH